MSREDRKNAGACSVNGGAGRRRSRGGIPAAGLPDLGRHLSTERRGDEPSGGKDSFERYAVLPARRIEEVHEVLGREVAAGAGGVRTPAGAARRRIETADPSGQPGRDIGERSTTRIVKVERGPLDWDVCNRGDVGQAPNLVRNGDPDRVAEADLIGPQVDQ